jgi:hypothetical protein
VYQILGLLLPTILNLYHHHSFVYWKRKLLLLLLVVDSGIQVLREYFQFANGISRVAMLLSSGQHHWKKNDPPLEANGGLLESVCQSPDVLFHSNNILPGKHWSQETFKRYVPWSHNAGILQALHIRVISQSVLYTYRVPFPLFGYLPKLNDYR